MFKVGQKVTYTSESLVYTIAGLDGDTAWVRSLGGTHFTVSTSLLHVLEEYGPWSEWTPCTKQKYLTNPTFVSEQRVTWSRAIDGSIHEDYEQRTRVKN